MRFGRVFVLCTALFPLMACDADPSVRMRWTVASEDEGLTVMTSALSCSEHGIAFVDMTVRRGGQWIEQKTYSCFPQEFKNPEALVDGPELEPGAYEIELVGRQRNGDDWLEDEEGEERAIAYATFDLEVRKGSSRVVDDIVFHPAPECLDGVDNDEDGRTDQDDVACLQGSSRK